MSELTEMMNIRKEMAKKLTTIGDCITGEVEMAEWGFV